jgi:hypothetical protein
VSGLVLTADGQPVSFFSYGYLLLDPAGTVSGTHLAAHPEKGPFRFVAVHGSAACLLRRER